MEKFLIGRLLSSSVTFNAEPTLLERQQESISERLKSYKSVTELLTSKDGAPIITTILQNNPLGKLGGRATMRKD